MNRSGVEKTLFPPSTQSAAPVCLILFLLLSPSSWLSSFLLPQQVLGSSSHKGRLVWVFLTGQIEVSLLPLLTEEMEGGKEEGRGDAGRNSARGNKRKTRTCNVKMNAGMQEVIMQNLSRMVIFMLWLYTVGDTIIRFLAE